MHRIISLAALAALTFGGAAAADDFKLDGAHAAAVFQINHLGVSTVHGRFNDVAGEFTFDPAPEKCAISVTIKADSIDTANKKRDDHLRGPDFFNTKQFPTLTFKSKSWKKTGDNTFDVTGDLTIHGVTKEVTVPVTKVGEGKDPWGGFRMGFDAQFTIKRADYGITFMEGGLGAEVPITVSVEGIKS